MAVKEGDEVPSIHLQTDAGEEFQFSDLKDKTAVLYFFPKANTPG